MNYKLVYCIGVEASKIESQKEKNNYGFDDDKGKYKVIIGDHIAYRYEICDIYGYGTFGVVIKALDAKCHKFVALKIIDRKNNIGNEAKILKFLKSKDDKGLFGIVHYYGDFIFRNHKIIVLETLSLNLYDFLKDTHFDGVSPNLIRRIASQLLQSLSFIHKHKIIHCDLKPENILFKELNRSLVKLVDFGTSCFEGECVFKYIQSRYYRAPEIILGVEYTTAIDIWSFGCILAELFTGNPIFYSENEVDQFYCILEYCGLPPQELIMGSIKKNVYFDGNLNLKNIKSNKGTVRIPSSKSFTETLKGGDSKFVEFIKKCLDINPNTRITAAEALMDPWILDFSMKIVPTRKEKLRKQFSLTLPR